MILWVNLSEHNLIRSILLLAHDALLFLGAQNKAGTGERGRFHLHCIQWNKPMASVHTKHMVQMTEVTLAGLKAFG